MQNLSAHLRVSPILKLLELASKNFPRNHRDALFEKLQTSEEKARLENPESVSLETACVAADSGVKSSVVCSDFIKAVGKRPMPGECATIAADEADEYMDVVGSSTPANSDMESEGITFRKSEPCFHERLGRGS